ncbi:MAG TPA: DNA replication and repair protein RecF [Polyangium sp.]|nr:DNA replication and repair protein RecF [Polyangium sp.]
MNRLELERLNVRGLRVLSRVDLEPARRLNVIWGNNGHGKTSLLEAIYFVATSRSFRTPRLAELVRHGESVLSVRARFLERSETLEPLAREQSAGTAGRGSGVVVRIDGDKPRALVEYATRSPVVVFHPDELGLSSGPALGRRTMLDRLALFVDARSAETRGRYAHALKARHELLKRGMQDGGELVAFEMLCAEHGAALTRIRAQAVELFVEELQGAFAQIAAPDLQLVAKYQAGGSSDVERAREELERRRRQDAARASAGFGPHRDDLELRFGEHLVRVVASQGQHRALTLAMKAAETATIAKERGVEPLLLLDDVSSELDPERTGALFTFLSLHRGQIFLTTTRPELIRTPNDWADDRADFHILGGELVQAG